MLVDIEKDVIEYGMNFDNTRKEPLVLPSRFPNLLVNGSIGIAVGMATNIPPHNLGEVIDATVYMIDHPDCTVSDLMQFIEKAGFPDIRHHLRHRRHPRGVYDRPRPHPCARQSTF